mgnify:FL=1
MPNEGNVLSRGTVHDVLMHATDCPERTPPDVAKVLLRMDKPYGYIEIFRYASNSNRILRYRCLSPIRLLGEANVTRGDVVNFACASRWMAGGTRMWVCHYLWKNTTPTWEDQ